MSHDDAQTQTMHGYGTQVEPTPAPIKAVEQGRTTGLPAELLAQFTREPSTVARLRHPAVQRVLERATSPNAQQPFGSVTSFMEALEQALAVASADAAPVAAAAPVADAARMVAAAPAPANPPSSLTQQFFAEGERQDVAHAVEDDAPEQNDPAAPVGRVPRNRAQIAMATVLAFGAVGTIVGTFLSLSTARDASPPASPVVVQRPADVPVSTPRAPAAADARGGVARSSASSSAAHRERTHQGRTAAPRARFVEPPMFHASPAPPAVATPPAPPPAPAAVSAPPTEAAAAPPPPPAPEDPAVVNEDDVTQPPEQTEGEAATTE